LLLVRLHLQHELMNIRQGRAGWLLCLGPQGGERQKCKPSNEAQTVQHEPMNPSAALNWA
jgi:hypothetical protein